jgi:hypothetical protein
LSVSGRARGVMLRNAIVRERYAQASMIDSHTNARRSDARTGVTLLFGRLSSDSVGRALLFFQTRQAVHRTRHNRMTCCPKAAFLLTAAAGAVVGPSLFAGLCISVRCQETPCLVWFRCARQDKQAWMGGRRATRRQAGLAACMHAARGRVSSGCASCQVV